MPSFLFFVLDYKIILGRLVIANCPDEITARSLENKTTGNGKQLVDIGSASFGLGNENISIQFKKELTGCAFAEFPIVDIILNWKLFT